jgi:predicted DCC family thiol-disulfide oxidoreductase YuxK
MSAPSSLLVLFDGHCNLCSGTVRFIIRRDSGHRFRFAPLSGPTAAQALHELSPSKTPDSVLLIDGGKLYEGSTAALRMAKHLDGLWPLLYGLIIFPLPLREAVYHFVARHRYRWFGKRETCWMPRPEWEFLFPDGTTHASA